MKRIRIDEFSKLFLGISLLATLLLNNGYYIFFPLLVFFFLAYNIQQPYKPGVFTLIIFQHYLQIAAGAWLCNYLAKDINYNTPSRSVAIIACSVGLIFLMAPVIYYQSKIPKQTFGSLRSNINKFSSQKVMYAYIIAFFIASSLGSIAFVFGGFTQVIISLVKVKWILFLLFGYQCILNERNKKIFFLFICLEFVTGFLGFFSDFKTVIFYLIVLLFSLLEKVDFKQVMMVIIIGLALGFFALVWTNIKGDYRKFLNKGEKSQNVTVDKGEALNKFVDLSSNVNSEVLNGSVIDFLDRLQYTYHFAKTIDRVPEVIPFQNGANWMISIEFTTTPRILNPDKPNYEATEKTKKYTGIKYAGSKDGVSFSLGYFPDCYIDFGLYGMMGVLLAIGLMYGLVYDFLMRKSSSNIVFNYATVSAFFLEFNALEMDSTYMLGRFLATLVTFYFLVKFGFPFLIKLLSVDDAKEKSNYSIR